MNAALTEIDHREFSSRFKLIRKERDTHFGEHQLMKDTRTKKRVIVKNQIFVDQAELDEVMDGISSLTPLKQCPYIVLLLGYSVNSSAKTVSLIYEYHDCTLEQSMKASSLHNKPPSDKAMWCLVESIQSALKHLYGLGLNHLDIRPANILEQNKDALDMTYKLLFTNYTVDAVIQLKNLETSIQSYFLSTSQLEQLQSSSADSSTQEDRFKSDMQSLGLVALHMGTLTIKDKYYTYGDRDEIKLNEEVVMRRLKGIPHINTEFRKQYSKKTVRVVEALLEGRQTTVSHSAEEISVPNLFQHQQNTGGKSHLGSSRVSEEGKDKSRKILARNSHHNVEGKSEQRPSNKKDRDRERQKEKDKTERMTASQLRKYQVSLEEIEKKIIYKPRTKDLLQNMQEKKYSDNSRYVGELSAGNQRQGKGIYYYAEGDVYAGEWQDNTLQGYGIYLFSNGEKYEGEVQKGVKSGKGQYIYSNGNRYVGDWLNDRKHGFGAYYYYEKGDVYEGSFIDGSKQGHGKYTFANGDYYEGSFHHGQRSGHGHVSYSNGTALDATFLNGEISGEAKIRYFNQDNAKVFCVKSQKQGNGSYMFKDGTKFEGTYAGGCRSGPANITYSNGDHYKGNVSDGLRDGYGVYTYKNGNEYQGNWAKNMKNGQGTIVFPLGLSVTTTWTENIPNEQCKVVYLNGDQYQGQHRSLTVHHGKGTYTSRAGDVMTGDFREGKFECGHIIDRFGNSFAYP